MASDLFSGQDHAAYRAMGRFYRDVGDILATLADIVQPRSFDDLVKYGLDDTPNPRRP